MILSISTMRSGTRFGVLLAVLGSVCACTSFQNILPDREKEYKYSTEIPPLEVPPDLTTATIENSPIPPPGAPSSAGTTQPGVVRQQPDIPQALPETVREEPEPQVERSAEGAYIRVDESFSIAWRMVGRALSRLEIEVEDLNRSDGLYYIIFEARRNKTDDSIWASLAFWSDANSVEEQRFQIRVDDKSDHTEVRVLDEDGNVLSEGTGLDLLTKIQDKINEQIAEK